MEDPSDDWLKAANRRYRAADILPDQRPWRAWKDLAAERKASLALSEPCVQRIFSWFRANTQDGAQRGEPLFRGAFFFDACFWPIHVPVIYGTVRLDLFSALKSMPDTLKQAVAQDQRALPELLTLWTACLDYGLGCDDLQKTASPGIAHDFLASAHRELCACVNLLLSSVPSANAAHSAALAIECFAKWLLAVKAGLAIKGAKRFGHDLVKLLEACRPYVPCAEIDAHIACVALMPATSARYDSTEPPRRYLWEVYLTAQTVAASLTRVETGRDCQDSLSLQPPKPIPPS